MGIEPHDRIGIEKRQPLCFLIDYDHPAEMFKIYLMANPRVRRYHLEIGKIFLSPFEQRVTFAIAFVLGGDILAQAVTGTEIIDLDTVVDYQLHGNLRINTSWVASQIANRVPHGCQVYDCGDAGEILHQDSGGVIGNFNG